MAMLFDSWLALLRVVIIGTLAYVALVTMLRITGKRTLSKMNAFDLVVTVALGSTLATVLLSKDVALAEGVIAMALLIGLQWMVAWLSVRSKAWQSIVKSEPRLLAFRGELLTEAMRSERITEEEVKAALRSKGFANLQEFHSVILETDGSVTVVAAPENDASISALRPVRGIPRDM